MRIGGGERGEKRKKVENGKKIGKEMKEKRKKRKNKNKIIIIIK